ncbi:hypothetical protein Aduo_012225 [Ancylostoma duodenale]
MNRRCGSKRQWKRKEKRGVKRLKFQPRIPLSCTAKYMFGSIFEETRSAGKKKASTPQVWTAKPKAKSGRLIKEEEDEAPISGGSVSGSTGSSLGKGASRRSDSSDEIKVTISPLPKQQKPSSKGPDKPAKSEKGRGSVPEKPSPLKDDQKVKPAATPDKTPKESERLRVKFDLQDPSKSPAKKNASAPGRDSRPTSPKRIC